MPASPPTSASASDSPITGPASRRDPAPSAARTANSRRRAHAACEQQISDVGAGEQQDEANGGRQQAH